MSVAIGSGLAWGRAVDVWDGVSQFGQGVAANALDCTIRDPGRAGEVQRRAVFLHPRNAQPATLRFDIALPALGADERLVLMTWPGLSDGVRKDDAEHAPDGVGIGADVDGERLFRVEVTQPSWVPVGVDLTRWAGRTVKLTLFTDDGGHGNTNYDWALIGEPRIVHLIGNARVADGTARVLAGGILVDLASAKPGASLVVTPLTVDGRPTGEPVVMPLPAAAGPWYGEFDVSGVAAARAVRVEVRGAVAREIRVCGFTAEVVIKSLGAEAGVVFAGAPVALRAVLRNAGRAPVTEDSGLRVALTAPAGDTKAVARLNAGEETVLTWALPGAREPGETRLALRLDWRPAADQPPATREATAALHTWAPPPDLPASQAPGREVRTVGNAWLIQDPDVRLLLLEGAAGPLLVQAWDGKAYRTAATAPSLAEVCLADVPAKLGPPAVRPPTATDPWEVTFPVEGAAARLQSTVDLGPEKGLVRIRTRLLADAALGFRALRGPAVLAGDGRTGARKSIALFPGLEYLKDDEPSSSTRDFAPALALRLVPDPYKVTIPLMAVETGEALVAVLWDQAQAWHGTRTTLSALFASPNFHDGQGNHKMQLFVPSDLDLVPENKTLAAAAYALAAGETAGFEQFVWVRPAATVLDAVDTWCRVVAAGVPAPETWPRSFEAEVALSRHGFLHSVWDPTAQKSQHVVGWANANAPQFAALLEVDRLLTGNAEAGERARLIADQTLKDEGEKGLMSPACCHILRGNLPFIYGHLDGAWPALGAAAAQAMGSMGADGSWRFHPSKEHATLGEDGAAELGLCALHALAIWRWARMSGDPKAVEAGRQAFAFMERFRVPAGAQGWECPIHEPDILASAYAVRAYVDAYQATGEKVWLERAVYWARTGLPFCYLWKDPAKPGMRYATIPVFGSTFFTHSWLALPVQWCGLVYAYALQQLAPYDSSLPWTRVAEGIAVSGMVQQWEDQDPKLKGTYPDSWGKRFTVRNGVFINPEDIVLPLYALRNADLEPSTAAVSVGGQVFRITSGGRLEGATAERNGARFRVRWLPGGTTCLAVPFIAKPETVTLAGRPARFGDDLDAKGVDATYNAAQTTLFLKLTHGPDPVEVRLTGLERAEPPPPAVRRLWRFDRDVAGWEADNACALSAQQGALRCEVRGLDPYFSTPTVAFAAREFPVLVVRARSRQVGTLGLFWGTDLTPGTSEGRHLAQPLPADGQWHELVFEAGPQAGWRGTVTHLRLDPEPADVGTGAVLEVEWVEARKK